MQSLIEASLAELCSDKSTKGHFITKFKYAGMCWEIQLNLPFPVKEAGIKLGISQENPPRP